MWIRNWNLCTLEARLTGTFPSILIASDYLFEITFSIYLSEGIFKVLKEGLKWFVKAKLSMNSNHQFGICLATDTTEWVNSSPSSNRNESF